MDISVGDLVFCTKSSFMQSLLTSVGEEWRHVGMVVETSQGLVVGEVTGGHLISSRTIPEIENDYEKVAVARLDGHRSRCLGQAAEWVADRIDTAQTYAWDDVLLVGIALMTRKGLTAQQLTKLEHVMNRIADSIPASDQPSKTCSAFICESFNQIGRSCRLSIPGRTSMRSRSSVGLVPSMEYLLGVNEHRQNDILNEFSIFDIIAAEQQRPKPVEQDWVARGHSKSSISKTQLQSVFVRIYNVITEYGKQYPFGDEVELDARWVTPGDIWRSPNIEQRRYLKGAGDRQISTKTLETTR